MRPLLAALVTLSLLLPAAAAAQETDNPWMDRRDLTIGHRGAVFDGPENTLYAMHQGVAAGAALLEFDLFPSADGEVVVLHDESVDRTTDGSGMVWTMTVEELKGLDAGYWHIPDTYPTRTDGAPDEYVYRGIATGDVPPPEGFTANDFTIPTLAEVLETFPDTWLLFEIKHFDMVPPHVGIQAAERMVELLDAHDRSSDNGIIASFDDRWLEFMQARAPQMSYAPGLAQAAAIWATFAEGGVPAGVDRYDILFLPDELAGIEPAENPQTIANANESGMAVHVFTVNDCLEQEALLDAGVHGIVTDDPGLLESLYTWRGARAAPAGSTVDPCAVAAVDRVAGDDRIETAARVSQNVFRAAGTDTIVLARADDYADALAGAPLASQEAAPVLLTASDRLSEWVEVEIDRLGVESVIVLGETAAVSEDVVDALEDLDVEVSRIGGEDRFATAALVADELDDWETAFVVEGANPDPARGWPDAVSAAPYAALVGAPILLTTRDAIPSATADAVEGAEEVVIVGGTQAVSDGVEAGLGDGREVRRIAGDDRYGTSRLVASEARSEAGADSSALWLATGGNWPDALAVGPAAAAMNTPLLLVHPSDLDRSPASRIALNEQRDELRDVRVAGGTAAVAARVVDQVIAILARQAPAEDDGDG